MATPTLETRLLALEQQIAPLVAGQTGKLSTKTVGLLGAIATGLGYVLSAQVLPDKVSLGIGLVAGGITAYLTAEET